MSLASLVLDQRRLVLLLAGALALAGLASWFFIPRQEDPTFPNRNALIIAPLPGGDAQRIERLIVEPIEDALADVDDIDHVIASARTGVAVIRVQLRDAVDEPDPIWDDVQQRLDDVQEELPAAALRPDLDYRLTELDAVMVALHGSDDRLALASAADRLEDRLLRLPDARRVTFTPDPGEQITIAIDDEAARRYGLSKQQLAQAVAARTQVVPGGRVTDGTLSIVVDPRSDFGDLDAIRGMPIRVGSPAEPGVVASVPLERLADVRRTPAQPTSALMRFNGRTALAVGVSARPGIDVVTFGAQVEQAIEELRTEIAPLEVDIVTNQPARVRARLADLGGSLLQGAFIVGLVLFVAMGLRLGSVVASIVPLVTLSSLAIYALAGGILQQISIAALVLSLGLLVDNAIVVAERVQARLDDGDSPRAAAAGTVRELAWPLFTASGTTLASFVPLLISEGPTGDFTRAIPQLVMLTLSVSFVFALTVTPNLAAMVFRPRAARPAGGPPSRWQALGAELQTWPTRAPGRVIVAAGLLVVLAGALVPFVRQQFFPAGDRNQAVLTIELSEGAHLSATSEAAAVLERALLRRTEVRSVAAFIGRSTPPFYYNLLQRPEAPHIAQLLVTTDRAADVAPLLAWARRFARHELVGQRFVARKLEQGPPIDAPVQFRLFGDDVRALWRAANRTHQVLRTHPGTTDIRHDLGQGTPTVALAVVDETTAWRGLAPSAVASAVLAQTSGLAAGSVWTDRDPTPIVVRSGAGERFPLDEIATVDVWSPLGPAPLANHAATRLEFRPSVLHRRDRQGLVTVGAQLQRGYAFNQVMAHVRPQVRAIAEEEGLRLEIGGESEGSGTANAAILIAAPMGGVLLLVFLLAQFQSFRRVGIVLATVPLAATGVIPGLVLSGQPFGFTSLLGVFALVGIVVNNAIILIDWIDQRRHEGLELGEAVQDGIRNRLRPILLTTVTTIVGLTPLLFSSSTLWPPLASALMSGLAASTGLTLLVVPALYTLVFRERSSGGPGGLGVAALTAVLLLIVPGPAKASELTLADAMDEASGARPAVLAARSAEAAARAGAQSAFGRAFLPYMTGQVTATRRDSALALALPDFPEVPDLPLPDQITQTPQDTVEGAVVVQVPVLQPAAIATWRAAAAERRARSAASAAADRDARLAAAHACLDQWDLDAGLAATRALVTALRRQQAQIAGQVEAGRGLRSDLLQVEVALANAEQQQFELTQRREVTLRATGAAVGREEAVGCRRPSDPLALVPETPAAPPAPRPELAQLDASLDAVRHRRGALRGGALPSVTAEGRYIATNNTALDPQAWLQGSLVATWTPVDQGARQAADRELTRERRALAHRRDDLAQSLGVAQQQAQAALASAQRAVAVRQTAVAQATEAARLVEAQQAEGRATVIDVLQLQAAERDQVALLARARHAVVRAHLELLYALGQDVRLP